MKEKTYTVTVRGTRENEYSVTAKGTLKAMSLAEEKIKEEYGDYFDWIEAFVVADWHKKEKKSEN